jgi:nicotinamidase-related amidase
MLTSADCVLVIVDVQGKLAQMMTDKETMFANIGRMIRGAQALSIPILWAEQNPTKLGPTIPEVASLLPDVEPIAKNCFSCTGEPAFTRALSALGRRQVLLVGMEAHVCVYQTAIDLLAAQYTVELVEDAVSSRIASNKSVAVRKMTALGVGLTSTEMALFELLGTAEHPAFREVQAVFK